MKKLAIIGSSGGNLYNQGGQDPVTMLEEIFAQAESAGIEIAYIQFIGTTGSMDTISQDAKAKLYTLTKDKNIQTSEESPLQEINKHARQNDLALSEKIANNEIDGLILLSCDPKEVNKEAITQAAKKKIPIAGTGGSSMGQVQSMGCKVISASGTTGTTNRTRAVSFISAFSSEWKLKYSPVIGSQKGGAPEGNVFKRINFRGIMMASMPGFIAMSLCLALSKIPGLEMLADVFSTMIGILPVLLAAIAAKQVSGLDEVGIVAGIVGGVLSVDGGIIGGLVVGIIAGLLAYYIISFCFRHKVPGTTANIAAGGLAGLIAGFIGMFFIAPIALWIGENIKLIIDLTLQYNAVLAGSVAGFCIWFAIIGGVYHAAILPIVLLEMESTGFSFLGSIDMCGLVMVSAGIMLGNIIFPRKEGDRAASIPGIIINLCFGTFVEAAYPFMFSSKKVFAGAIAAATISGAFVGLLGVKGTAYVPSVVAPFMANEGKTAAFALCMLLAMGLAFAFTAIANKADRNRPIE